MGRAGTLRIVSLASTPLDPARPLWQVHVGDFGPGKGVAWSLPVSIEDVKAVGAPAGAKVNDVLVAAVAGALRGHLKRRDVDVGRTTLRDGAGGPARLRAAEVRARPVRASPVAARCAPSP